MTQNDESGTSDYVASASATNPARDPYRAFDNVLYSSWHEPVYQVNPYPNLDGAYTGGSGTVYNTNGYQGEYLQIQLPEKIKLYNYSISNRAAAGIEGRQPKDAKIFASNDGTTWIDIHTHSDGGETYDINGETRSFQLYSNTETYYKYYRLVVNSIIQGGTSDTANISQWKLFGTPEYDPEAHGVDVVVKSVPNVPNTDWLDVYYDGQDYTQTSDFAGAGGVDNKTGVSTYDATPSAGGVGFDSTYKAFTFNKTDNQYLSTSTPMSGNYVHSFSLWFKPNSLTAGSGDALFYVGGVSGSSNYKCELFIESDRINYTFGGNNFQARDDNAPTIVNGEWYHITVTYNGLGGQNGREIYLNNVKLVATHSGSTGVLAISTNNLDIGRYTPDGSATTSAFDGSIANFRLFNRVLTPDEIYQLYAYQKEYFGHGDLSMTLKAGRLGIGTSQPRGALDVRGDTFSTVFKGGRPTFLAWDYLGQRSTNFSAASSSITQVAILDHTFDIPSCYHHLGTANLKAYVKIDWRGESEKSWNFGFRVELSGKTGTGVDFVTQSSQSDNASALGNKINGLPCISYHAENFDSTPTAASVTSMFSLPNCDVSSGSKLKVNLIGKYGDNAATVLWTGRTKGFSNALSHELPTNSFFVILDVEDGY